MIDEIDPGQEVLGAFVPVGCAAALTFDVLPFGHPPFHAAERLAVFARWGGSHDN
jgi:hypothetical protein